MDAGGDRADLAPSCSARSTRHSALPPRRLIINADDLGLSPAVNRGVVELHEGDAITSASLLMNLPATADALARTAGSDLPLGVHLNLITGRPLRSDVPSLCGPDGCFVGLPAVVRRLMTGRLRLDEVEREWAAQIEALQAAGRRATHLDSHLHVHGLPGLMAVACRLARRYGIGAIRPRGHGLVVHQVVPLLPVRLAARWRLPLSVRGDGASLLTARHLLVLTAMAPRYDRSALTRLLHQLPPGLTELVVHPGYVDDELCRLDPLRWPREEEMRLLRADWWRALLTERRFTLTSYRDEWL